VPGLLQTGEYATAAFQTAYPGIDGDQLCRLAAIQARRQEALLDSRQVLQVVIDESALRRVIGSPGILARQLAHLAQIVTSSLVTVRVAELAAGQAALSMPFALLNLTGSDEPTVAWSHGIGGQISLSNKTREVDRACDTFAALSQTALSGTESGQLIRQLAGQSLLRARIVAVDCQPCGRMLGEHAETKSA
jgi:hypothetical protein